jgi:hypothetical protein
MFQLRNILTSHFSAWYGGMDILDEIWLPKWLDRRLDWTKKRDERQHRHVERLEEAPPVGKDATQDW